MSVTNEFWWEGDGGCLPPVPMSSLRFQPGSNTNLQRNQVAATNTGTSTWSAWVKLGSTVPSSPGGYGGCIRGSGVFPASTNCLYFFAYTSGASSLYYSDQWGLNANGKGTSNVSSGANTGQMTRDFSAWYHVVVSQGPGVGNGDMRIYINNQEIFYQVNDPISSTRWQTGPELIGNYGGNSQSFSGYISNVIQVDGQSLLPTSFGEYNTDGVWVPKVYTGSYGANGYFLDFDPANFTSGTNVWADQSGNGNDFTATWDCAAGVSANSGTDIMSDSPTTNEATWNPLYPFSPVAQTTQESYAYANKFHGSGRQSPVQGIETLRCDPGGQYTIEILYTNVSGFGTDYGACNFATPTSTGQFDGANYGTMVYYSGNPSFPGISGTDWVVGSNATGAISTGTVLGMEIDRVANTVQFYINGVAAGNGSITGVGASTPFFVLPTSATGSSTFIDTFIRTSNFQYTYPNNWPLSTASLPEPTIPDGSVGFQALLDTGANILTTAQAAFPNGLWWVKDRVNANQHQLLNSLNGSALTASSPSLAIGAYSAPAGNSVAWCWEASEAWSIASGTNGTTIASSGVRNLDTGFSIAQWTGNRTPGTNVGHGLSVQPEFIIIRALNNAQSFQVWHTAFGTGKVIYLDTSQPVQPTTAEYTAFSDTYVQVGNSQGSNDIGGPNNMIMYAWNSVPGYSAFGSYVGNGSADGPFVYTGFRPAFVLIKPSSYNDFWFIYDDQRDPYNLSYHYLNPNTTGVENTNNTNASIDMLSNGFKLRHSGTNTNTAGGTLIYAAFAENPFGGQCVAPATAR